MKQKHISSRAWLIIIGTIFLAALVGMFCVNAACIERNTARIYQDGRLIHEIDIAAVREEYSFSIPAPEGGENVVSVRTGGICVSSADCADNTCVRQGWLEHGITPIVCLPHRLVIQLEPSDDMSFDAAAN